MRKVGQHGAIGVGGAGVMEELTRNVEAGRYWGDGVVDHWAIGTGHWALSTGASGWLPFSVVKSLRRA